MHPYMTEQLVRDRQAALDAEARGGRLARRVETRARPFLGVAGSR
jgi:hypothetical protein